MSTDSKISSKTSVNNDSTSEIATDEIATTTSPTTRSTESDTLFTEKNFDTASQLDDLFAQVDDASMYLDDKKVDNEDVIRFDDNTDLDAIDIDLEDEPLRFDDESGFDESDNSQDGRSKDNVTGIEDSADDNSSSDNVNADDGLIANTPNQAITTDLDNAETDEPAGDNLKANFEAVNQDFSEFRQQMKLLATKPMNFMLYPQA